ncbi:MAG: hypothetical protein ACRD5R_13550 [Candidatus Acidiferrales bacterium]
MSEINGRILAKMSVQTAFSVDDNGMVAVPQIVAQLVRGLQWFGTRRSMVQIHSPRPLFESATYNFSNSRKRPMSAWHKTERRCLMSVARVRSLPSESIALQGALRFTGNPILGTVGTRSPLWEENPKPGSSSASCQDAILPVRELRAIIRENVYHGEFVRGEGASH